MRPMGRPAIEGTSATSGVSTTAMMAPMMIAPTTASAKIVVYCRRMNATAPSKMVPATSCIAAVPWSRDSTSRASHSAKTIAAMPAIGMIQLMASATVRQASPSVEPLGGRCQWPEPVAALGPGDRRSGRTVGRLGYAGKRGSQWAARV